MKHTKIIIAAILALALTACSNTDTAEITEEITGSSVSETASEVTTTEVTTTEEITTTTEEETTLAETTVSEAETITETTEVKKEPTITVIKEADEWNNRVISYDGGFSLELKDITPDTDLLALANAVEHKMSDGEFEIDLDGDGKSEKIFLEEEYLESKEADYDYSEWLELTLYDKSLMGGKFLYININGEKFVLHQDPYDSDVQPDSLFVCDIDSSDEYMEIACIGKENNDFYTKYFRYENGALRQLFTISNDTPDGKIEQGNFADKMNYVMGQPIITDGSGVITAAYRLDCQTWFAYAHYLYDSENGSISLISEPVYPYYYENINNFDYAKEAISEFTSPERNYPTPCLTKEIDVYAEPNLSSGKSTISPQNVHLTAEYPSAEWDGEKTIGWVYIIAEDGSCGWLRYDYDNILPHLEGVFDGLIMYD